ncbi:MAG: hypothetical protein HZB16_09500 [Armatimonadetes bacterium]|nr:hypothetical protein [Armatimonadota bacterium]
MVRVQKSARKLELSGPAYCLAFDADRPWVVSLAAGTGRPVFELFLGSSVDTLTGRDELQPAGAPFLTREGADTLVATYTTRSSRWGVKRYVFACRDADIEYWVEVEGSGRITTCRLFQGFLARDVDMLGLGASYFRPGYERPYRDLARGSRCLAESIVTARPNAAERDAVRTWEDSEIDLTDDPSRHGGLDSFLPAPWAFAFDLGAGQPWALAGLAPSRTQLGFTSFAFRGGETIGFELNYPSLDVSGKWRSPGLVFNIGARDEEAALRAYVDCLRRRDLCTDERPPAPDWWRGPIFDGSGEQHALQGSGAVEDECTQAVYRDALALLRTQGLNPSQVWLGPGWLADDNAGRPDPARWPNLKEFVSEQHHEGRRVVVSWPLRLKAPAHLGHDPLSMNYRRWIDELLGDLLRPDGLDVDGLRICDNGWPDGQWLHDMLTFVRGSARAVKPEALIVAPTVNPCYAHLVDMVTLGSLWSDRRSVADAVRRRALLARSTHPDWLLAVQDLHAPGRDAWREVIELGPKLGVPVLSYARHLEQTGESLDPEDFDLVRRMWREVRP